MRIEFEGIYSGANGKRLLFTEGARVIKVKADSIQNGVPSGAKVLVQIAGVKSVFSDYGDLRINADEVLVQEI